MKENKVSIFFEWVFLVRFVQGFFRGVWFLVGGFSDGGVRVRLGGAGTQEKRSLFLWVGRIEGERWEVQCAWQSRA